MPEYGNVLCSTSTNNTQQARPYISDTAQCALPALSQFPLAHSAKKYHRCILRRKSGMFLLQIGPFRLHYNFLGWEAGWTGGIKRRILGSTRWILAVVKTNPGQDGHRNPYKPTVKAVSDQQPAEINSQTPTAPT